MLGTLTQIFFPASRPAKSWLALVAIDADATEKALPFIRALHAEYPRVEMTVFGNAGESWMHRRPVPPPWATHAFLKNINMRVMLFAGVPGGGHERLRHAAYRYGCALAMIVPQPLDNAEILRLKQRYQLDHIFTFGGAGKPVPIEGWTDLDRCELHDFIGVLKSFAVQQVRNIGLLRRTPTCLDRLGERISDLKFSRIASIDHLRELLGSPATVMCLGNGPSSETPALGSLDHDCLFRANLSWAARGWLAQPDVVFTNLIKAIRTLHPKAGFIVRHAIDERFMRRHLRWHPRTIRLGTAERLGIEPPAGFETLHQTHGAMMLAAAVALRPKRLIVAGIDLFADAAGAYPGDPFTVNGYALGHDREHERRYIVSLLQSYDGELVVFGEALRQALAEARPATGHVHLSNHGESSRRVSESPQTSPQHLAPVVAIAQPEALGDLIATLPMACAIKRDNPAARMLLIAREYSRPLVEASRWIDGYLDVESVVARPEILREHRVSVFINIKKSKPLIRAAFRAGVAVRIGRFSPRTLLWTNRFLLHDTVYAQRHRALLNLAFLKPLGLSVAPTLEQLGSMLGLDRIAPLEPSIRALLHPARFNLVLHPKSNGSGREWPAAHYDRLVDLLPADRVRVFVTGRANERAALLRESALIGRPDIVDLTDQLDLGAMISFLQAVDGIVASGTGPLHIAAGVGTRALGLFPGRDTISAARWHPLGPRGESLSLRTECRPEAATCPRDFSGGPCPCLSGIAPETVAARVRQWLEEADRERTHAG